VHVRSLGFRTDLMIARLAGSTITEYEWQVKLQPATAD
jgi:hypothetical protein